MADPDHRPPVRWPLGSGGTSTPSSRAARRRADVRATVWTVLAVLGVLAPVSAATAWALGRTDQPADRRPGVGARLATPDVVWLDGAPQGRAEQSAWAQTVRDWKLAYAVAFNARDVSDATFAALSSDHLREELAQALLNEVGSGRFATTYYPGPRPFAVTDVAVEDGGQRAVVTTCEPGGSWDAYDAEDAVRNARDIWRYSTTGYAAAYTVERRPDGGRTVVDRAWVGGRGCELGVLALASFDPAPPYGTITQPWEVIGADGLPLVDPPGATPSPTTTP